MTVAYVNAGTVVEGTTPITPGAPASLVDGNGIFIVRALKPSTAQLTNPAGWTVVGQNSGGAGSQGVDTGPTRVGIYFREKSPAWSAMPSLAATGSPNSAAAMAFQFSKDLGKVWEFENRNGTYNSSSPGLSLNVITSAIDLRVGDWVCTAVSNHSDTPSWSLQSYVATGIVFSTITEFSEAIEGTTGNDVGVAFWGAEVTAGSGLVTVQQLATASANSTGAVVFMRLRESFAGWGAHI